MGMGNFLERVITQFLLSTYPQQPLVKNLLISQMVILVHYYYFVQDSKRAITFESLDIFQNILNGVI